MQVYLKATIDLMVATNLGGRAEAEDLIRRGEVKQLENGLIYLVIKEVIENG